MIYSIITLLLVISYGDGKVIDLTDSTFNQVLSSDGIWFVKFYATWCGHCQRLAPEWIKAADAYKGIINFAEVDAEKNQMLSSKYKIDGYPTLLVFGADKQKPVVFQAQTAEQIMKEGARQIQNVINTRLGGDFKKDDTSGPDVVELTDDTFDQIMKSKDSWLIAFVAPWCGHCQRLEPEWNKAAAEAKGTIKFGRVDATVNRRLASTYEIRGFPTIKFFAADSKHNPVDYDGGRQASDIVQWVNARAVDLLPTPELKQIVNQALFTEICESNPICIIAVMPPLIDCQSECRNRYLGMIKEELPKFKRQRWGWGWISAMDHSNLEAAIDVSESNYPALAAISIGKKHSARMFLSFSSDNVHNFLNAISTGAGTHGSSLRDIPKLDTVEPWDGKDEPLVVDDDDVIPPGKTEL